MIDYAEFHDPNWENKREDLIRLVPNHQCVECDMPATMVHICYHIKGVRIWNYPNDAYKCYCQYHWDARRKAEDAIKRTLTAFSTNELDPLHLMMQKLSGISNLKREAVMFRLYDIAKNEYFNNPPREDYEDNGELDDLY